MTPSFSPASSLGKVVRYNKYARPKLRLVYFEETNEADGKA